MNIVVKGSEWRSSDLSALFDNEAVIFTDCTDMASLVFSLGLFSSRSQAKKAGRTGNIPTGFTEIKGNKKTTLWIWNPSE